MDTRLKDNRVREYLLPVRILMAQNVKNAEYLLSECAQQVYFWHDRFVCAEKGGKLLLDFGRELHGGIRVLIREGSYDSKEASLRIRFGESVGEALSELGEENATNHHSTRDRTVHVPPLSDMEFGQTGFRFVCIDFLSPSAFKLVGIYAVYIHRDLERVGNFNCNDLLINKIYDTACNTVYLNMQTRLWDGIKRDRLVWIGDMHPEIKTILYSYGDDVCIRQALLESAEHNPLPAWISTIPTYSIWWVRILCDYWMFTECDAFFLLQLDYLQGILRQLDQCVFEDGSIDYQKNSSIQATHGYFLDWESSDSNEGMAGNAFLYLWTLKKCTRVLTILAQRYPLQDKNISEIRSLCGGLIKKLSVKKYRPKEKKQILAFGYLAGCLEGSYVASKLIQGGAKGYSCFMSGYILAAVAESTGMAEALKALRVFYGGMLSRGATSFWESFDIDWLKGSGRIDELPVKGLKDIHSSFGKYCYQGYRLSLCHGWASGPVSFLYEKALGIRVVEPGFRKIKIAPCLGDLQFAEGVLPTPYGKLQICCRKREGNVCIEYDAPKEICVET